jgi:hypothetical protein
MSRTDELTHSQMCFRSDGWKYESYTFYIAPEAHILYVVVHLSIAAAITSAPVDFGTRTRIFSMSSDFGTAFRCHGDVFAVAAAAPCGLSWGWLLVKVGL